MAEQGLAKHLLVIGGRPFEQGAQLPRALFGSARRIGLHKLERGGDGLVLGGPHRAVGHERFERVRPG